MFTKVSNLVRLRLKLHMLFACSTVSPLVSFLNIYGHRVLLDSEANESSPKSKENLKRNNRNPVPFPSNYGSAIKLNKVNQKRSHSHYYDRSIYSKQVVVLTILTTSIQKQYNATTWHTPSTNIRDGSETRNFLKD